MFHIQLSIYLSIYLLIAGHLHTLPTQPYVNSRRRGSQISHATEEEGCRATQGESRDGDARVQEVPVQHEPRRHR